MTLALALVPTVKPLPLFGELLPFKPYASLLADSELERLTWGRDRGPTSSAEDEFLLLTELIDRGRDAHWAPKTKKPDHATQAPSAHTPEPDTHEPDASDEDAVSGVEAGEDGDESDCDCDE